MRKTLFLIALVMVSTFCFAQKGNVKKAKVLVNAEENPDFDQAKELIEAALKSPDTKDLTETVWTAGYVYDKAAFNKRNNSGDPVETGNDAIKACEYYSRAYEMDNQPNAKGKIKPKYSKKIYGSLTEIYKSFMLVNAGVSLQQETQEIEDTDPMYKAKFAQAYRALATHISIVDMPAMQADAKSFAADTMLHKNDSYNEIKYYAAIFAYNAEMYDEAMVMLQEMRSSNYKKKDVVYQLIADIYQRRGDMVNYENTLAEGAAAMPSSQYLVGSLINLYIERKEVDKAINYLNIAIQNNPTPQLYNVLGTVYKNKAENIETLNQALTYFMKAVEMDPNFAFAQYNVGDTYYTLGILIEEEIMSIKNPVLIEQKRAEMLDMLKKSIPYIEKAYELDEEDRDAQMMLRRLYYRVQRDDKSFSPKYPQFL